jgi:hypothetical protein
VAFTAGLTAATALDAFHHVWWLLVISGVAVSILTTRLPRRLPRRVDSRLSVPVVEPVLEGVCTDAAVA